MQISFSNVFATLVASAALAAPLDALAASGGVRIIVQSWTPTNPTAQTDTIALDRPGLLTNGLNAGWAKARGPICTALENALGKPDLVGSGYTLYNMDCAMAQTGMLTVTGAHDNVVTLDYRLPSNMFRATSTQPSVAGKYADPCAFIYYDVDATTTLHLDTLAVDTFRASIDHVSRPDSCNTAGDLAKFFATTYHFFGGPDYLAIAQDELTKHKDIMTGDLNAAVSSFVGPLRGYASQYAKQTDWVRHGDLYFVFAPAYVPPSSSAVLSGAIDLPKANGFATAPGCGGFSLDGSVQTGPAPIIDPETLRRGDAPTLAVGSSSVGGAPTDGGEKFSCAYSVRALPSGVPVAFHAHGPARTADHPYITIVGPEGWSGIETLAPGAPARNFIARSSSVPVFDSVAASAHTTKADIVGGPDPRYAPNAAAQANPITAVNPQTRVALNPQPLPPAGANALVTNGNVAFERGDFSGAASFYQRAVTAQPADAIALYDLAIAHAKLGDAPRARAELQRAARLAQAAGDAHTGAAVARSIIIVGGANP